jgi:hypothetical protein
MQTYHAFTYLDIPFRPMGHSSQSDTVEAMAQLPPIAALSRLISVARWSGPIPTDKPIEKVLFSSILTVVNRVYVNNRA